jgi:hypothetical protein
MSSAMRATVRLRPGRGPPPLSRITDGKTVMVASLEQLLANMSARIGQTRIVSGWETLELERL